MHYILKRIGMFLITMLLVSFLSGMVVLYWMQATELRAPFSQPGSARCWERRRSCSRRANMTP